MINFKIKNLFFSLYSPILVLFFVFSIFSLNVNAVTPCDSLDLKTANPADVIRCGSPDDIAPTSSGRSLYEIILTIANTLALIAVFFSIIGVIVGVIYLAKAQSNKTQYEEAKGIISNSLLAFGIIASLYVIVRLILNQLGIGDLAPVVAPVAIPGP